LQISAANLLVAGQQPTRSSQQAAAPPASPNTASTEFAPIDFNPAPKGTRAVEMTPASSDATPGSGTPQRLRRPGSQLDIRV
jgi:hypothetical protein